jgi:hypothetical protein
MQTRRSRIARRLGATLLEVTLAGSLMAVLVTASAAVMRSANAAWLAHEADAVRIQSAHATLRHIVRRVRQSKAVTSISLPGDIAGILIVQRPDSTLEVWMRNGLTNQVLNGLGVADQLLAEQISQLSFIGYKSDGVTSTLIPSEIHALDCRVRVNLTTGASPTRDITCRVWLRTW